MQTIFKKYSYIIHITYANNDVPRLQFLFAYYAFEHVDVPKPKTLKTTS